MQRSSGGVALARYPAPADERQRERQRDMEGEREREPEPSARPEAVFALVYRQMRALAGQRDVDELVQVAAEQALRALPSFAGRSKLSTWTFRICYLTMRKHDRWYGRWLRRFTLTEDGELPEVGGEAAAGDDRLVREERVKRVRGALARLSHHRRTAVVLHDLEGLSVDEIAEIVAVLPRTVRSRLRDGRNALAEILEADPYFGTEACRRKERR
jgi:RNA polymerase sigma-70 factor, ECF subfamily